MIFYRETAFVMGRTLASIFGILLVLLILVETKQLLAYLVFFGIISLAFAACCTIEPL